MAKVTNKIEELFLNKIDEQYEYEALDFLDYLKSLKLTVNNNQLKFKGKRLGGISITDNACRNLKILAQYDEYLDKIINEESDSIKEFVNNQTRYYSGCGRCITGKCACTGIAIEMNNSDIQQYNFIKKLIALRIEAIVDDRVPKCNYIKLSERGTMKKCNKCKVCNPACRKLKKF